MTTVDDTTTPIGQLSRPDAAVPNLLYLDDDVFRKEVDRIFRRVWLFVCHTSEIANTGDFRTTSAGGYPIVVCRDRSGTVRTFLNVCRHRSQQVVLEPSGNARHFRCFYHLWTYGLGGQLLSTGSQSTSTPGALRSLPNEQGYDGTGFCKEDFGLVEYPTEVRAGLVFVCFDRSADAPTVDDFLGDVLDAAGGVLHDRLEVFHYHQQDVRTNWKLFAENDREGYHTYLHHLNVVTHGYMAKKEEQPHRWRRLGNGHMIFGDHTIPAIHYDRMGLVDDPQEVVAHELPGMGPGGQFLLYLFPDVFINVRANVMRINRFIPVTPGLTRVEFRGLGMAGDPPEIRRARERNHNLIWGYFGMNLPEDVTAVERQWGALRTRSDDWSVIARDEDLRWEDDVSMREFHAEWGRRMGSDHSELARP